MNRIYQSSSFFKIFVGTRKHAIEQAIAWFNESIAVSQVQSGRYTFRADDESGFTIRVYSTTGGFAVECAAKWNAARN